MIRVDVLLLPKGALADLSQNYTDTIKETVPSCADEVADAFGPLEEDLSAILAIYNASEAPKTQ